MRHSVRILAVLLPFLMVSMTMEARAQWVLAFQEQMKRDLNGILFVDDRYGWVIGNNSMINSSQDGGEEWSEQLVGIGDVNLKDICFLNRDEGWMVASKGNLLRTVDGGENWKLDRKSTRLNSSH